MPGIILYTRPSTYMGIGLKQTSMTCKWTQHSRSTHACTAKLFNRLIMLAKCLERSTHASQSRKATMCTSPEGRCMYAESNSTFYAKNLDAAKTTRTGHANMKQNCLVIGQQ